MDFSNLFPPNVKSVVGKADDSTPIRKCLTFKIESNICLCETQCLTNVSRWNNIHIHITDPENVIDPTTCAFIASAFNSTVPLQKWCRCSRVQHINHPADSWKRRVCRHLFHTMPPETTVSLLLW